MISLKKIFDFYINSSIHVSIATSALVLITYFFAQTKIDFTVLSFVFLGTLVSYNAIKYGDFILKKKQMKPSLKLIIYITIVSFIIEIVLFFTLNFLSQLGAVFFALLSLFYFFPIKKANKNLRNLAGIKIYIVSFCWAGVTLLLPLLNANVAFQDDFYFKFLQRFVLTLLLILIFEIRDLKYDDLHLKTVPQTIGIAKTKQFIYFLLIVFYVLEFFKNHTYSNQWLVNLILVALLFLLTFFVNENKSKYYTLFWVESITILWCLLIFIFK